MAQIVRLLDEGGVDCVIDLRLAGVAERATFPRLRPKALGMWIPAATRNQTSYTVRPWSPELVERQAVDALFEDLIALHGPSTACIALACSEVAVHRGVRGELADRLVARGCEVRHLPQWDLHKVKSARLVLDPVCQIPDCGCTGGPHP